MCHNERKRNRSVEMSRWDSHFRAPGGHRAGHNRAKSWNLLFIYLVFLVLVCYYTPHTAIGGNFALTSSKGMMKEGKGRLREGGGDGEMSSSSIDATTQLNQFFCCCSYSTTTTKDHRQVFLFTVQLQRRLFSLSLSLVCVLY